MRSHAAIADALGPAALVETAETPAGFLHMYRQATLKKGGLPTLSEQAVEFARHLEDEAKTTAAKSGRP